MSNKKPTATKAKQEVNLEAKKALVETNENATVSMSKALANDAEVVKGAKPSKPEKKDGISQSKNDSKKGKKANKEKKPNKIIKKSKEVFSELKKVSWPKFGTVCKKTGVVLVVVIVFAAVIFGIDRLLSLLFELFTKNI